MTHTTLWVFVQGPELYDYLGLTGLDGPLGRKIETGPYDGFNTSHGKRLYNIFS